MKGTFLIESHQSRNLVSSHECSSLNQDWAHEYSISTLFSLLCSWKRKRDGRVDTVYHKMRPNYSHSFFLASLPTKLTVTSVLPASNWRLMGRVLQYSIVSYCMCVSMEVKINYSIVTREKSSSCIHIAWQLWRLKVTWGRNVVPHLPFPVHYHYIIAVFMVSEVPAVFTVSEVPSYPWCLKYWGIHGV